MDEKQTDQKEPELVKLDGQTSHRGRLLMHVSKDYWDFGYSLTIGMRGVDNRVSHVLDTILMRPHKHGAALKRPPLALSDVEAKEFMTELWNAGLRPNGEERVLDQERKALQGSIDHAHGEVEFLRPIVAKAFEWNAPARAVQCAEPMSITPGPIGPPRGLYDTRPQCPCGTVLRDISQTPLESQWVCPRCVSRERDDLKDQLATMVEAEKDRDALVTAVREELAEEKALSARLTENVAQLMDELETERKAVKTLQDMLLEDRRPHAVVVGASAELRAAIDRFREIARWQYERVKVIKPSHRPVELSVGVADLEELDNLSVRIRRLLSESGMWPYEEKPDA